MRPHLFIEKIMPVNLLNQQVYYEHGGNPFKGLHRWYSRKPLSFSRASVLGSILPADISLEEFEYLLGLEPGKEIKLYKTPPSSVRIKRDPNAAQAWWDDLRPEVANLVEQRAPEFEANGIKGINLYLSALGPALNVFSRSYPILDSSGEEVRPEVAFAEARKAIANYRFLIGFTHGWPETGFFR